MLVTLTVAWTVQYHGRVAILHLTCQCCLKRQGWSLASYLLLTTTSKGSWQRRKGLFLSLFLLFPAFQSLAFLRKEPISSVAQKVLEFNDFWGNNCVFLWMNQKSMSDDEELPLQEMASSIGLSTSSFGFSFPLEAIVVFSDAVDEWVLLVEVLWGTVRDTPNWKEFASFILLGV